LILRGWLLNFPKQEIYFSSSIRTLIKTEYNGYVTSPPRPTRDQ